MTNNNNNNSNISSPTVEAAPSGAALAQSALARSSHTADRLRPLFIIIAVVVLSSLAATLSGLVHLRQQTVEGEPEPNTASGSLEWALCFRSVLLVDSALKSDSECETLSSLWCCVDSSLHH